MEQSCTALFHLAAVRTTLYPRWAESPWGVERCEASLEVVREAKLASEEIPPMAHAWFESPSLFRVPNLEDKSGKNKTRKKKEKVSTKEKGRGRGWWEWIPWTRTVLRIAHLATGPTSPEIGVLETYLFSGKQGEPKSHEWAGLSQVLRCISHCREFYC